MLFIWHIKHKTHIPLLLRSRSMAQTGHLSKWIEQALDLLGRTVVQISSPEIKLKAAEAANIQIEFVFTMKHTKACVAPCTFLLMLSIMAFVGEHFRHRHVTG